MFVAVQKCVYVRMFANIVAEFRKHVRRFSKSMFRKLSYVHIAVRKVCVVCVFLLFANVPKCSSMFLNVPKCSWRCLFTSVIESDSMRVDAF